jgi:hypothetical protein
LEKLRAFSPSNAQSGWRLALLLWSGLHGVISLRINKPTLDWPLATELAEQVTRAISPQPLFAHAGGRFWPRPAVRGNAARRRQMRQTVGGRSKNRRSS